MLLELLPAKRYERFAVADKLRKPHDTFRERVGEVLPFWLSFWYDVFIYISDPQLPLVNLDLELQIQHIAAALSLKDARELLAGHDKALQHLDQYANVRLLVENLMLDWPRVVIPDFELFSRA
jgi:hypothetical protein